MPGCVHKTNNNNNVGRSGLRYALLVCLLATGMLSSLKAQVLFTYGKHAVSRDEFLKVYNKNNMDTGTAKLSYPEYLELYIRFKLKVQAALDDKMDTLPEQRAELQSFRYQLAEGFLKEDASINLLVEEAFKRTLKDIHLSQIFIPVDRSADQTKVDAARQQIDAAYERLQKGGSFEKPGAPLQYSGIGYVTAFALPYAIENVAYSLREGEYSRPFRSSSGFHILRNDKERKAVGKMRVAQILLRFPPGADAAKKKELAARADSIYALLKNGADFAKLAEQLSEDHLTYAGKGEIPAFGVGQYDTVFEKAAFSLRHDGDITAPFTTSFGYHILSRIQHIPVIEDSASKPWREVIRERVLQSDRMTVAHEMLVKRIRELIKKEAPVSVLANDSLAVEYYRDHLEKYNNEFAEQLNEFKEGNLLFAIMQKKIWDASTADSNALKKYYQENQAKYKWENSADALIITCLDPAFFEETQQLVKNKRHEWREWSTLTNGKVLADSGRFELNQIPIAERTAFIEGLVTAPVVNEQDSSRTFAYIIRLYTNGDLKQFEDAKGAVINDYQNFLEESWIAALKKKYAVRINKKVLQHLPKQ